MNTATSNVCFLEIYIFHVTTCFALGTCSFCLYVCVCIIQKTTNGSGFWRTRVF